MDLNESLTTSTPTFDPEAWKRLWEAVQQVADSIAEAFRRLAEAIAPIIKTIVDGLSSWWNKYALRSVATPKEWHIYTHTKKRRIREKYRKRLARRLLAELKNARRSDPPSDLG